MEIVTGAMNTLLPKLAALLTDEYKLHKSLRGEIMVLKAELESMQAALERLSEVPAIDNQIKIWARDVRELSYDIEDSIDKFMVRIDANPSAKPLGIMGFIEKCMRLLTTAKTRHQIATDIKGMKTLMKEVAERRDRYKVDNVVVQPTTTIDPRLHGMYEESSKFVAISGPSEELTELLMEREGMSKHPLKVISIVGVGGLGKTTLANVLYQQLRGQFECHAFVSVSLKPDLKRILSSMLRQVSEQSHGCTEAWDVVELINKIRHVLEDKSFFHIGCMQIVLQRNGPWGGHGWKDHDIMVAPRRLERVEVSSGVVVDALGFSYRDRYGKQHRTPLWGGVGGSARTIELGPSEFVTEVSGTYGRFNQFHNVVTSLMLVTNIRSCGPFGQPRGTPFRARAQQNGSIVGFFARSSVYLQAIGVYIHP